MQQFQLKLQNRMSLREQLERKRDQKKSTQVVESTENSTASSVQAVDQKTSTRIFSQTFQNDVQQERVAASETTSYSEVSEQGLDESDNASSLREPQNLECQDPPQGPSVQRKDIQ